VPLLSPSVREIASSDNEAVKELKQLNSEYGQEKFEVRGIASGFLLKF